MLLSSLRKGAATWIAKLLFVILIASFGAWGIGDFMQGGRQAPLAEIGDIEISAQQFTQEFNREFNRLRQAFGGQLDRDMAVQLGLPRQVLSQMVSREVQRQEAAKLGIVIDDHLIRDWIQSEPAFQVAGRFDRVRFSQALLSSNMSEDTFIATLRADLARDQLTESVRLGAQAPTLMAKTLYGYRQEQRVAELVLLTASAIGTPPEPSDADLAAFHQDHSDRFMAPEYRVVTAVVLKPEDLLDEIDVPAAQVREAYDARIEEFQVPERREVAQLLFKDEAAAKAAHDRLAGGAGFDAVAEEAKAAGADLTDIGEVRRGELFPREVEEAVFALPEAGVTEPVKTALGWHVLRVAKIVAGETRPFEAVHDTLRRELALNSAADLVHELAGRLEDAVAGGASLEEAAASLKLRLVKIAAMDRDGKGPDGKPIADLPGGRALVAAAFVEEAGRESQLTDAPDGAAFILRVDSITPAAVKPLEAVRDQVAGQWRHEATLEMGRKAAQAMAEQIAGGQTLTEVAAARGLEARSSEPFARTANDPAAWLPRTVVEPLFGAKVGEVVVGPMGDGFVVARLAEIRAADPAGGDALVASLRDQVTGALGADLLAQLDQALRRGHGVTVDERALSNLF